MKKSLLLSALLSSILLAGCTTTNSISCPTGSEYYESKYDNGNLETQGCFKVDSDVMEGHRIYYFENGGKDMEGDIVDDLAQGKWTFYSEDGNNVIIMEGNYKDDLEDGKRTYYYDDGEYLCSEIYSEGEIIDEGDCKYDEYDYQDEIEEMDELDEVSEMEEEVEEREEVEEIEEINEIEEIE